MIIRPPLFVALAAMIGAQSSPLSLSGQEPIPPLPDAVMPGSVVFSEIMWMGSEGSSADEWVELRNLAPYPVDLEGWTITRLDGEQHRVMIRIPAGRIAAGGTYLIANYGPGESRSHLAVEPDLVSTAVALPNSQLQLALYDGAPDQGGELIDVADDGKGLPLAGATSPKAAMVRSGPMVDGRLSQAWSTATEAAGWKAGSTELGTPGGLPATAAGAMGESATAVAPSAWAWVKAGRPPP
ncbi:MAG: lamin tail domain-containing protein [Gemmatimonadota bacterium]